MRASKLLAERSELFVHAGAGTDDVVLSTGGPDDCAGDGFRQAVS
jgi:hypothetical protein